MTDLQAVNIVQPPQEIYTLEEAAEFLRVKTTRQVKKYMGLRNGLNLPAHLVPGGGGRVWFTLGDLKQFVVAQPLWEKKRRA